jgi:hypothetical protein
MSGDPLDTAKTIPINNASGLSDRSSTEVDQESYRQFVILRGIINALNRGDQNAQRLAMQLQQALDAFEQASLLQDNKIQQLQRQLKKETQSTAMNKQEPASPKWGIAYHEGRVSMGIGFALAAALLGVGAALGCGFFLVAFFFWK